MDAGKRLGLSAQQVLDACQSLYETHQLTTYPRSDCAYLPAAHHAQATAVLDAVARQHPALASLIARADRAARSKAWNDAKVTAHHAIIPTPAQGAARALSATEAAVYDLIARRYLAQFFPAFEYVQSELAVDLAGHRFRATGRQITAPGWKALYATPEPHEDDATAKPEQPDNPSLPPVRPGDPLDAVEVAVLEKKTQPPKPFTDAALIGAMCNVAKFVSDPAIQKILSDADGIGTPATRAAIIETLFARGYVERRKKTIVSTPTGRSFIAALPPVATTPDMTAVWEAAMRTILDGQQPLGAFLERIAVQLRQLIDHAKTQGPIAIAYTTRAPRAAGPTGARSAAPPAGRSRRTAPHATRNAPRSPRPSGR
jgi:DNA topoisomerase-3